MKHVANKEKVSHEFYRRITTILHTKLNASNQIISRKGLAMSLIIHSFNIIKWTVAEIKKMNSKTINVLSQNILPERGC